MSEQDPRDIDPIEAIRALLDLLFERFGQLEALRSSGTLRLAAGGNPVSEIRLEALPNHRIQLARLVTWTDAGAVPPGEITIDVHDWQAGAERRFDPGAFVDPDAPAGPDLRTQTTSNQWVTLNFQTPQDVTSLDVHNTVGSAGEHLLAVTVVGREPGGREHVLFDGAQLARDVAAVVASFKDSLGELPTHASRLLDIAAGIAIGDYQRARVAHRRLARSLDPQRVADFRSVVNERLLFDRRLEWTVHGAKRSFRFWTLAQKQAYIRRALQVVEAVRELTPDVCFGFGTALAAVRDGDLIPHDDDIDLIVGFNPEQAADREAALALISEHFAAKGFRLKGELFSHRQVSPNAAKTVDVFVAVFDGDHINWYPAKPAGLTRQIMFPPSTTELLGIECPLPADPEKYLEEVYGP